MLTCTLHMGMHTHGHAQALSTPLLTHHVPSAYSAPLPAHQPGLSVLVSSIPCAMAVKVSLCIFTAQLLKHHVHGMDRSIAAMAHDSCVMKPSHVYAPC